MLAAFALATQASFARSPDCFKNEIDPQTGTYYQNQAQWQADMKALNEKFPSLPNLFLLRIGYKVGVKESKAARHMRPDKRQHCYVGCRIANDASYEVAVYAAYYKEWDDLSDCDPKTDFDLKDIDATLLGAFLAAENPGGANASYCSTVCKRKFSSSKRRR